MLQESWSIAHGMKLEDVPYDNKPAPSSILLKKEKTEISTSLTRKLPYAPFMMWPVILLKTLAWWGKRYFTKVGLALSEVLYKVQRDRN